MSGNEKPKRFKTLHSFFNKNVQSSSEMHLGPSTNQCNTSEAEIIESQRVENNEDHIDTPERDPGVRRQICNYPANERDNIRLSYIQLGPCQPLLDEYPPELDGDQNRRFNRSWFTKFHWLEYSCTTRRAYCFPCFLFDKSQSHQTFTVDGFINWKRVGGKTCAFKAHIGHPNSAHHLAMQQWQNLRNPSTHIAKVADRQPPEKVMENILRLKTTIESVRYLANQAMAFRGNDESNESVNRGNFLELVEAFGRNNAAIKAAVDNAPLNAKYNSPKVQKDILHIWASKVREKIREELGDNKFCILVDEAQDSSNKEQMAIILRFVDDKGFLRERFFDIVNVSDTTSQTLKYEISKVLDKYNLLVENLRGQGYDGASNMRGEWKGLQALFLQECPYAYYVHCFAHRLQLTLNGAAENVTVVWRFFSTLNSIVTFVSSSTKRATELKQIREDEIEELLDAGVLKTGKGANQTRSLQRPGATRWSSHFKSVHNLIELFSSTKKILQEMRGSRSTRKICGEAEALYVSMMSFDFAFVLNMLNEIMGITDILCQHCQKKSIDIITAIYHVSTTKSKLQKLREDGWDGLLQSVVSFCELHDIDVPDLDTRYRMGTGRSCQQRDVITMRHHYQFDVFNAVIDLQMRELDDRFPEQSKELLILSSALDPRDEFDSYKPDDICLLAEKFYPGDFTASELYDLKLQLSFYGEDIRKRQELQGIPNLSDLCRKLVETRLAEDYYLIHRLICLVLTLPVSTATTERAFSAMKIIKNRLRNKIEDEFFGDCMTVHIEREFADSIDNDSIMDVFAQKNRRAHFKVMT